MSKNLKKISVIIICTIFIVFKLSYFSPLAKEIINNEVKNEHRRNKEEDRQNSIIPSRYDLRDLGYVTPVKNQGGLGTCWAFAAMGSLESCALKKYGKELDFSEINMARLCYGLNGGSNDGAVSYLTTWMGPVYEEDSPYPGSILESKNEFKKETKSRYHVQEVIYLPSKTDPLDNNDLKRKLMKYGGVTTNILYSGKYYSGKYKSYYNPAKPGNGHAVLIVGWDDNFPKENFTNTAPGNGAFICKNSWGTGFGERGYFYVSYYNLGLKFKNAVFNNIEPINNYDEIYPTEANIPFGRGSFISPCNRLKGDEEKLAAVSLFTKEPGECYEVYIKKDYDEKVNRYNILQSSEKVKKVYFSDAGFHTIKLDKPIDLGNSKRFAVIFNKTSLNLNGNNMDKIFKGYDEPTYGMYTRIYTVKKNIIHPTKISLNKNYLKLDVGKREQLTTKIIPDNSYYKDVTWTSSDENIVKVSPNGILTVVNKGKAVITVQTLDGQCEDKCVVEGIVPMEFLSIDKSLDNIVEHNQSFNIRFNNKIKNIDITKIHVRDENGKEIEKDIKINNDMLNLKVKEVGNDARRYELDFETNSVVNVDNLGLRKKQLFRYMIGIPKNIIVKFKDNNLEQQLKYKLRINNRDITSGDMQNIENLYLNNSRYKIKNLDGLQYAINLKSISLSDTDIISLKPLEGLIFLRNIIIESSKVNNLFDIGNLFNLTNLNISHSKINSIKGIGNLQSLTDLNLSYNKIEDISEFKCLQEIKNLNLSNNNIKDVSSLEEFKNLKTCNLSNNRISEIQSLMKISDGINLENLNEVKKLELNVENNNIKIPDKEDIKKWAYKYNIKDFNQEKLYVTYFNGKRVNLSGRIETQIRENEPIILEFNRDILVPNKELIKLTDISGRNINSKVSIYDDKIIIVPLENIKKYFYAYINLNNLIKDKEKNDVFFRYDSIRVSSSGYIYGDLNKDEKVDIKDLAILSQEYGEEIEIAKEWSFDKDINENGVIDIYDIVNLVNFM